MGKIDLSDPRTPTWPELKLDLPAGVSSNRREAPLLETRLPWRVAHGRAAEAQGPARQDDAREHAALT